MRVTRNMRGRGARVVVMVVLGLGCRHLASPPPGEVPGSRLLEAERLLAVGVAHRVLPGGVLAVGDSRGLVGLRGFGRLTYDPRSPSVTADTLYDLASLTKVVATTAVAMTLVDEGRLDLEAPVSAYLPCSLGGRPVRVRDLLAHASGLPPWAPLYRELRSAAAYVERICGMDLEHQPGTRSEYSDLGFIVLGALLEEVGGASLDVLARTRVFEPLGMHDTLYRPGRGLLTRVAPTELEAWRGRLLHGEAHDPNAYAMGGVAPHAGLFGTAGDLGRLAEMLLGRGVFRGRRLLKPETVQAFTQRVAGSSRMLGWETPPGDPWAGALWSESAYGHTGLTGTVLWIDPGPDQYLVLLTNRVHPAPGGDDGWRGLRCQVSEAVVRAIARPAREESGGCANP